MPFQYYYNLCNIQKINVPYKVITVSKGESIKKRQHMIMKSRHIKLTCEVGLQ